MTVQLREQDGQLVLLIPPDLATAAGLRAGTEVTIAAEPGQVVARRKRRFPYTLDELVAGITPENCHGEWDTGPPVGNEVW